MNLVLVRPLGSPPRVRGKAGQCGRNFRYTGITPACAGKSRTGRFWPGIPWDHPRVCGEKPFSQLDSTVPPGSPPRVRGKGGSPHRERKATGITPACAGKSCPPQAPTFTRQDHPRLCGEKSGQGAKKKQQVGSPPRMRGKGTGGDDGTGHHGITPAYAEKRCSARTPTFRTWDHPRVCGEKNPVFPGLLLHLGAPPRVRGKACDTDTVGEAAGITPACAGKSSIQHLTASLGEFKVQKGHPVPHLRQRLQVWPDHARHLRHGLILHASRSAGQGRRLCPGPCPDTAGSGTPRGPSPAKRPHTSPPAATPGGCRAWQSGATAPGSR